MITILVVLFLLAAESTAENCDQNLLRHQRGPVTFKKFFFTQILDHFNFLDERTFKQRYFVNGKEF